MSKSKDLFMKTRENEDFLDADYLYIQWLLHQPPKKEVLKDHTRTDDEDYEDFIDLRPEEPQEVYNDDEYEY
jgi:hypothetical protein